MSPSGYVPRECYHEVPHGTAVERDEASGEHVAVLPSGERRAIPRCSADSWARARRAETQRRGGALRAGRSLQLPADYKGWTEYAAAQFPSANASLGWSAFTSIFTTPDAIPAAQPDVLYLFPALQNINWIPLVDPEPATPFDIVQPVIQYPADTGSGWSVKSWWVTLDVGAMASTEVALNPGDGVFGNMTRVGAGRWFIDSVNTRTGQHTALTTPRSIVDRLRVQPWAYITAECYGCVDCSTYPTAPTYFKEMAFACDDGSKTAPAWWVSECGRSLRAADGAAAAGGGRARGETAEGSATSAAAR